jgi:hypothetical protein
MTKRTRSEIQAEINTNEERAAFHEQEAAKLRDELGFATGDEYAAENLPADFWTVQMPACVKRAIGDKILEGPHTTGEAYLTFGRYQYSVIVEDAETQN